MVEAVVIVETNWVIDVALEQDNVSRELYELSQEGRVQIYLPTFCIAESVKAIETKQRELRRQADGFRNLSRELSRSAVTSHASADIETARVAAAAAHDDIAAAFWPRLEGIIAVVHPLHFATATVALTAAIHDSLPLSPADSAVLATAVTASQNGLCNVFMSRDTTFAAAAVAEYIAAAGLVFHLGPSSIVGPLRQ